MYCETVMRSVKKSREYYNKLLKYLLYVSLTLLVFNIIYLQNRLIVYWINNNMKYGSVFSTNTPENIYISEDEIDFENILIYPKDIKSNDSNIFFIETTCCTKVGKIKFKPKLRTNGINLIARQACAIESAANANRDSKILILYSCPIDEQVFRSTTTEIMQIFRYKNVKLVKLETNTYFEGTPVQNLYLDGILETSKFPLEHTSDVLRFLTLWKYGGTYLDLDVLCLRPLSELGTNFAGYELITAIGSAVINLQNSGIGYEVATQLLTHLSTNFNPKDWSHNGPNLVTKILFNLCNSGQIKVEEDRRICNGFSLYKKRIFYPIPWNEWRLFFNSTNGYEILELMKNSYAVHLWNKRSHKVKVFVSSQQPFDILATQYCQLVHSRLEDTYFVAY